MNIKTRLSAAALAAGMMLHGCGESSSGSMTVVQPQNQALDTQQVLALARVSSDTGDPVAIGNGGLMIADADDNASDPEPVG